jgi:hypothetical protein
MLAGWLVAALCALTPQVAAPTGSSVVRGIVVDGTTGRPLGDAHVAIVDLRLDTQTDPAGRFEFPQVAPGSYTITISTVGYIFVRRRIEVPARGVDLTVPLAAGTGTYEESVTVTSADSSQPAGATRELSSGDLQDLRGVAADDPVRAVQALPGVATGDDFQAEFSVRGSAFRHVGLVVDTVATPLLFHAVRGAQDTGSIAMINTDILSRASLSIGARANRDGDWLGATLTFDVREGSRDRPAVRVAVSGTNTSSVVEGPIGGRKRGSWLLSLRKSYVGWLVRKLDPEIESTVGFADVQGKVGYDLTARQHVEVLVLGGNMVYSKPSASGPTDIQRASSTSVLTSIGWRYIGPRTVFRQRLSVVANRFRNRGLFFQEQAAGDTRDIVWRGDITVPLRSWTFDGGLQAERERSTVMLRNFASVSANSARVRAERSLSASRTISSGWAQVGGRVAGLGITTGARVSGDTLTDVTTAVPWILANRRAGVVEFTAGASRAIQFPTIDRLAQAQPGSSLLPEEAWLVDGGARVPLSRTLVVSATVFRRGESNILRLVDENRLLNGARVTESIFPTLASTLEGTAHGVDVAFERRSVRGPTGWVAYTWAHTHYEDHVTGEAFDGDFDQRHTLNVFVQQRLSYRLKASAKFRYGSNFPIVGYYTGSNDDLHLASTRNGVRLPPYARLDLSGSRTFTFTRSRLTLFVEVVNATGRRNFGPADGFIRSTGQAVGFSERLIPFLPSAGMLVEF